MEIRTIVPSPDARIMLVGEAPTSKDIQARQPFSGGTGHVLNKVLTLAGIYKGDCIIANCSTKPMTKFFTTKTMGTPTPEFELQIERLRQEIIEHNPNIIIALGAVPMYILTGNKSIKQFRGFIAESTLVPGKKVLATYSPRAITYEWVFLYQVAMDLRKALHESETPDIKSDNRNLVVAPSKQQALQYLNQIYENRDTYKIAIDLEHTTPGAHISWFGISHSEDFGMSIQFIDTVNRQPTFPENDELELISAIARICNSGIPLIFHNASYDVMNLWHQWGVWCENLYFDTLLAAHVLWPEFPRDLGFLGSICLNVPPWKHTGGKQYEHGAYNAADAANTRGLYEPLYKRILEDANYSKTFYTEMAQVHPAGFMQLQGMQIDVEERDRLRTEMQDKMTVIREGLSKIMDKPINLDSPKQLANLLYVDLGLPPQYKRRKSASDPQVVTTDKEALEALLVHTDHDIIKLLLEYRRTSKMLQFIDIDLSPNNTVHTSYNIAGTQTGRWSSSKSIILDYGSGNLQNQDRDIRSMYTAPPGYVLVQADYVGAEAHVVSHLIQDHNIIAAFDKGLDVHKITAAMMFQIAYEEVTSEQRRVGKTLRHGVNYSAGPKVLGKWLKITRREAENYLKQFHNVTPQLSIWHQKVKQQLEINRTLITPLGRKRVFMQRWGDELFRSAYAFIPQSTIGDLLNLALTTFYNSHNHPDMGIAMQLHDAIYIWCREDEAPYWGQQLHRAMHIPIPMEYTDLYIGVDFKIGHDWKNMDKLEVTIDAA